MYIQIIKFDSWVPYGYIAVFKMFKWLVQSLDPCANLYNFLHRFRPISSFILSTVYQCTL